GDGRLDLTNAHVPESDSPSSANALAARFRYAKNDFTRPAYLSPACKEVCSALDSRGAILSQAAWRTGSTLPQLIRMSAYAPILENDMAPGSGFFLQTGAAARKTAC